MQFVAKLLWEEPDNSVCSLKINKTNTNMLHRPSSGDSFHGNIYEKTCVIR